MGDDSGQMMNVEQLKQLKEQLPEEEKEGNVGKAINYVVNTINAGWSLVKAYQNMEQLNQMDDYMKKIEHSFGKLIQDESVCKEQVLEVIEEHHKNCTEAFSNFDFSHERLCEDISNGKITEIKKIQEQVLETLAEHHRNECNKAITDMVKGSGVLAALYLVKIYRAWKEISAASNVINDSNKFDQIEKSLGRMKEMVAELLELCSNNPEDKSIDRKMNKINAIFNSILSKISDLRLKIDGHIQRLDLLGDYAVIDSAMSFATAGAQGFQLWSAWGNLTSFTRVLGSASVGLFALLGLANAKIYFLTQDKLEDLRKDLKRAVRLKDILDDLYEQAEQAIG